MIRIRRGIVATIAVGSILLALASPAAAGVDDRDRFPILIDAVIMRPLGLAATIGGFVYYGVFVAPLLAITRPTDLGKPWRSLVVNPARFTFVDELGWHPDRTESTKRGEVK